MSSKKNARRVGDKVRRLVLHDDNGEPVGAGDVVTFNYGIPPVHVVAPIVMRGGHLIALTPGHYPPKCNLRRLREYAGGWLKQNNASASSGTGNCGVPGDGSLGG